ncbi:unnamed protein product [Adineta steineri]|uniref:Uncharacterized protein n=1 Tax=Adineta steineri TaxID=433720 RepID=A0A813UR35_9BILA|nr:unnamed protein product [Adineta steineri]CAF0832682.1 unnamed protein product [Adineta steineri]CAF0836741.1 unnamed protein product [Adineta steineri]
MNSIQIPNVVTNIPNQKQQSYHAVVDHYNEVKNNAVAIPMQKMKDLRMGLELTVLLEVENGRKTLSTIALYFSSINRNHFAAAMIGAESSMSNAEINKYEMITGIVKYLRELGKLQ